MPIYPDHIFREYDIRGKVDSELSEQFAFDLGRAYAATLPPTETRPVAIGYDCRLSSPGYAAALASGIASQGYNVDMTGMGPTPQLYFAIFDGDLAGGIQVTGSHNPSDMNGFKICRGKQTLSGKDIQELKQMMLALPAQPGSHEHKGAIREAPIRSRYLEMLIGNSRSHIGPRKLRVVVDAGNGVGGLVGPEALRALGVEVTELYCEPDGRFPNHHPDPAEPENLHELIRVVREKQAHVGIAWDGDADRIGVVDEKGEILFGDMLLLIYARAILKEVPEATIIGDVKCSHLLFQDLRQRGANPVMWRTGHSLIKQKLRESSGHLAGEMSGHMFFQHRYYGFDDAVYAALRLVEILSNTDAPLSSLLSDLPKTVSTPEIRMDCPEDLKFKIPERVMTRFQGEQVSTIDGVRITFANGWGLVRASNTQPVLVLRFEAENEELLTTYRDRVMEAVRAAMQE